MVKKYFKVIFFVLICVVFFSEDVMAEIKTDFGGSVRLRQEYWENVIDFETTGAPDRNFFRLKTNLWGKVDFTKDIGIYGSLTNEARYYMGNYMPFEIAPGKPGYETSESDQWDEDELVIDQLHFTYNNILGLPFDIRIGRQNFIGPTGYGEYFLILDGTPGDGSRTAYFDAIKATWRINKSASLDLIYLSNSQSEDLLPSLNPSRSDYLAGYVDNERLLNISDEKGFIAYLKTKPTENLTIEPYYMFKQEDGVGHNYTQGPGPTDELSIHAVGARAMYKIANWTIRGEFAHQEGEYDSVGEDRDREGNGGYLFFGQKFADVKMKPEWELGYVYMSGDDPDTKKHEGWDPLWSRGPSWNEIFTYTLVYETMGDGGAIPGYWTNLHLFMARAKLALSEKTSCSLSYQYLRADEETSAKNPAMFSNDSKDRGHIGVAYLNHTFTKQLTGFLQLEYFKPGDFYTDDADDAVFFRWELQFKF